MRCSSVTGPRGATLNNYEAMVVSDAAVVITGLDTVTGVRDGQLTVVSRSLLQNAARIGRSCISIGPQCRTDMEALSLDVLPTLIEADEVIE